MNNKLIILAPHLKYPLRNGGDIYVDHLGRYLSVERYSVKILGADTLTCYANGLMTSQEYYKNTFRSRLTAALRTVALGSHYYVEKFLTPAFMDYAFRIVSQNEDELLVCSYLATAHLLDIKKGHRPIIILTHNDEITWFQNQRKFSANPLIKLTSLVSERWVRRFLDHHAQDEIYIHITESDSASYRRLIPKQKAIVVPAGIEILPLLKISTRKEKITLLFCGSLSVQMNYDALAFFQNKFWPPLNNYFLQSLEIWIAGSKPSKAVYQICNREGWQLFANLTDETLNELYKNATFGILPFPYTAGAKLKLLNFLAAGLPVLGTSNMCYLPGQNFSPNLYSDDPQKWLDHICLFNTHGIQQDQRAACQNYVSQFSWLSVVAEMSRALHEMDV